MSDNTDDIGLITEQELCKQLGISAVTVQRMRYEGWGPRFVVLGPRRIAYRPSAISEWLSAREVQQGVAHRVNTSVVAKEGGDRGSDEELIAQLRAENEKLRERLAGVNDENQRMRQSVKEYLSNLARVTNDMLREMWEREAEDERHC